MATPPEDVRAELMLVTAAGLAELREAVDSASPDEALTSLAAALPLLVPEFYDAAGTLAADWYEDLRDEVGSAVPFDARVIGDPTTDWIERELEKFQAEFQATVEQVVAEAEALTQKEIARGFRDTITGNAASDPVAIGWSRHTRGLDACKLCKMLADKGSVFRSESTATFAAHTNCHCVARPEFEGGEHGPEASAMQYVASLKRRTDKDRARLRAYLNEHYPDARG